MKNFLKTFLAVFVLATVFGATARAAQQRVVGEVTAIDASTGQVTVRTDAGETVAVSTDARTEYFRVQPGETSLERAEKLTRADLRVGDRVVARGTAAGQPARQLIVTTPRAASAAGEGRGPQDAGRRLIGRVASVNASKREISVQTFGRGGAETLTLSVPEGVRLLRFAPDSLRPSDARPGTFADLHVGDQLRATGQRAAEGSRFTPEEIISGSFMRLAGGVTAVAADRNEFTVRDEATGQTFTVAVGKNSLLRRATPEFTEALERRGQRRGPRNDAESQARREERRRQREASGGNGGDGNRGEGPRRGEDGAREGRGPGGEGRGRGGPGGGRGPQQMFESLPVVTVADLKKGDTVLVTATHGADSSRVTLVALVAGDADFLQRLMRGNADPRNMSPGLPSDVIGGGGGGARQEQPGNPN